MSEHSSVIDELRTGLGPVGAILGVDPTASPPADVLRDAAQRIESAGWPALWTNETVGADALVRCALWLGATRGLVVGTSIANMWVRPAATAGAAADQLAQAFPGRFVLGLGVGRAVHAAAVGRDFGGPTTTARDYLDGLGAGTAGPAQRGYPVLLAANGAKLLDVAATAADGALPAGQPPESTLRAREVLGGDKLLVVFVPVTADSAQRPDELAATVRAHREAGADHVIVGRSYDTAIDEALDTMLALAPILLNRD